MLLDCLASPFTPDVLVFGWSGPTSVVSHQCSHRHGHYHGANRPGRVSSDGFVGLALHGGYERGILRQMLVCV